MKYKWFKGSIDNYLTMSDLFVLVDAMPSPFQDTMKAMCGGNAMCQPKNCFGESDCPDGVCLTLDDGNGYGVCSRFLMPDGALCINDSWCASGKCSRIFAKGTCDEGKTDLSSLITTPRWW